MDDIKELQKIIDESKSIVFFGGAGVSTESGIKDFRSVDGLYNEKYDYPPETILSHAFFMNRTEEFYKFYKDKLNTLDKYPNITHKYLVKLEKSGKLKSVITQNIDGLHEKAGTKNLVLLHGTIYKNHCMKCNKEYSAEYVFSSIGIPTCSCGGIIKPDVTLYGEDLDPYVSEKAIEDLKSCDTLIVAGTSLVVYPAAYYIRYFKGKNLIIINKDRTTYDNIATLLINKPLGEVISKLKDPS